MSLVDYQCFPLNLYLINTVEDIVVFRALDNFQHIVSEAEICKSHYLEKLKIINFQKEDKLKSHAFLIRQSF